MLAAAAALIAPAVSLAAGGAGFAGPPVDSPLGTVPPGHARPPSIHSPEAIVVDATTGTVLYVKNPAARRPIASTTKLMTALITLQTTRPDQVMTAQPYPATPSESTLGLVPGERMTVNDLLHALLLASANDAAVTLADGISGSEKAFVARMNAEAHRLGLHDTRYANPVGLDDPNGYSSARDLATLTRHLLRDRRFASIVDMSQARLTSGAHPRKIVNRNDLVGTHRFVDGVKTGHTSHAGYILVGAAHRDGAHVISVVLDEPSQGARDSETLALLRYGLGRFTRVTIHSRTIDLVNVKNYDLRAPLRPGHDLNPAVLRGSSLRLRIYPPIIVRGPLPAGYTVGDVTLYANDQPVTRAPLVTAERVPEASLGRVILIKLSNGDAALGCGVLGVALLLALRVSRSPMLKRGRTGT